MHKARAFFIVCAGIFLLALASSSAPVEAQTFTTWTSVDLANNVAQGTIGSINVTFGGGELSFFEPGSTGFNASAFCPPLPTADLVEFVAVPGGLTYTIMFSRFVHDPILHVRSLSSTLTFSGVTLTRLCGQPGLTVSGNQVIGNDCLGGGPPPIETDYNGTVRVNGWVKQLTFTATFNPSAPGCSGGSQDGIHLQIGADPTQVPGIPPLGAAGLAMLMSMTGAAILVRSRRRAVGQRLG